MIICLTNDSEIIAAAEAQSINNPHIYGAVYVAPNLTSEIPKLDYDENLFFTGHGVAGGDGSVPEIGDEDGDFALNGLDLWATFSEIFPDGYTGAVYIDCCYASDAPFDSFALTETFKSQFAVDFDGREVFGRSGGVGFDIPLPGDASWNEVGLRGGTPTAGVRGRRSTRAALVGDSGNISPAGPWDPGRQPFILKDVLSGMPNLAKWRGVVDTENQRLSGEVNMTAYQLKSVNTKYDFFSAYGSFGHGIIRGNDESPSNNTVSVGYYATTMSLMLELANDPEGAVLWDYGPGSSVGQTTTGFSIGGNLSAGSFGGEPIIQGGASAAFSASYTCAEVQFGARAVGEMVRWDVGLPGVGSMSPGVPANPHVASGVGYKWYFAVIYAIPKGEGFHLRVRPSVTWEFDYTRGITYDTKVWAPQDDSTLFVFQPPTAS